MDLLSCSHATIVPHVRQIAFPLDSGRLVTPDALFRRISALSALQSIIFKGISLTHTYDSPLMQDAAIILGSLTKLTCLELFYLKIDTFRLLRDVVAACRGLEKLYLDDVVKNHLYPDLPDAEPMSSPCPPLRLLKTCLSQFNEELFEWVVGCTSSLRLGSLCISFATVLEEQPALGRFLRALGPSLRELAIHSHNGIRHEQSELRI